ncbi:hypothetical protein KIW84_062958 [Lathyrus oleraceus]|uniref:Uncharacterized protein n=1 Tax=Pisum sativum TaxID=3888 RepID=A0A9D4W791_PEA|nr:hypothetical protein KIW84_062958 [Pisum sativum]
MIWSKETTSESCDKKSSHYPLQNQKHHVPMMLNSTSKISLRKCKQYIKGDKVATNSELVGEMKYGTDNAKDLKRKSSTVLCSTPSDGKKISLPTRHKYGSPAQNDRVEFCVISRQDYSHLSDIEDFMKRPSYLMNKDNFYIHARDLMDDNSNSYDIAASIKEKLKEEDMDFVDSRKKFLPSRSNHLPRPFVPVGPRFQAEVPEWEATTNMKQYNSHDCLKWLGTQIWPSLSRNNAQSIRKGRPSSSENLESVGRVEHYDEARECLQSKVNDAF